MIPLPRTLEVHQLERRRRAGAVQQVGGVARSDQMRMDAPPELVEQAVVEQQPRHIPEAVLHDVATGLALEVADAGDDVAGDHLGVPPLCPEASRRLSTQ
jgi:hypothetical protein